MKTLTRICQNIWEKKKWPEDWKRSVYIPIPKKGDILKCENHRTIALISHSSKVMLKIIQRRLADFFNEQMPREQAGFRKGRGTRDHIANLRWIIESMREKQRNLVMCFIDYSKAFDCVDHDLLWLYLREMGAPLHIIQLLKSLYKDQEACVRTDSGETPWFEIGKGVRQGCILSPTLFNLYSEMIMRKALEDTEEGAKIGGLVVSNLRYADDTTLLAESEADLEKMLKRVQEESRKAGLSLNIQKTKIMATAAIDSFAVNGEDVEIVESFNFLGLR
uniref:Endonuclease-reverse transcriptase n=1 Tax=Penaeus japonicus TaxID=27405 RepID=A0A386TX63_PENJP|nr:endonuclease-reverse transcriptase [Penaeus japonicus]